MRELFDLSLHLDELSLVVPDDATIEQLARQAARTPVLPNERRHWFMGPWAFLPEEELVRSALQFHWHNRSMWTPHTWKMVFILMVDGEPVGSIDLGAEHFPILRQVGTGSWILPHLRGRRIGVRMRAMVLDLAFEHLDAELAVSAAHVDNVPSNQVSRSLGYLPNGVDRFKTYEDTWTNMQRWKLMREGYRPHGTRVAGLEACKHLFDGTDNAP